MLKILIAALLASLLISTNAAADKTIYQVKSTEADINVLTDKVAHIIGEVNYFSFRSFQREMAATATAPGERLIVIDSTGGYCSYGDKMIELLERERERGITIICFVREKAHSMAFNFLTHCDIRLSTPDSSMLVHKIAYSMLSGRGRLTAKKLREIADELDKDDEKYRIANSKAMGLTLEEYDSYADADTYWTTEDLIRMKYLHGSGTLE